MSESAEKTQVVGTVDAQQAEIGRRRRALLWTLCALVSLSGGLVLIWYGIDHSTGSKVPYLVGGMYATFISSILLSMRSPEFERRILRFISVMFTGPLKSEEPKRTEFREYMEATLTSLQNLTKGLQKDVVKVELAAHPEMQEQIVVQIKESLTSSLLQELRNKYGIAAVEKSISETKDRLNDAISTLGGRVNQNLWYGVLIFLGGWIALIIYAMNIPQFEGSVSNNGGIQKSLLSQIAPQLIYFLPRLSIVFFVELFSYFFLALYKAGLDDLKYYQNELTNIESREAALHATLSRGSEELLKDVVSALITTDRNSLTKVHVQKRSNVKPELDSKVAIEALSKMESVAKAFQ